MKVDSKGLNVIHDAGRLAWVHCHGKMNPVLDRFIEMGVDCLNPVEPPPMGDILLSDAKRRAGGVHLLRHVHPHALAAFAARGGPKLSHLRRRWQAV